MRLTKIALTITYEGTSFAGWQDNKANLSIEGLLKKAFYSLFNQEFSLDAASRTDKGVHALKQIVITYFDLDKMPLLSLIKALNSQLPLSIRVIDITEISQDFHPSLSAKTKTYLYQIDLNKIQLPFYQNTHWHIPHELNIDQMKKASKLFIGTQDFTGFSNVIKKASLNPFCTIDDICLKTTSDNFLMITITGDRFLYKMCRIIVGTLVGIGKQTLTVTDIQELFKHKKRVYAGITAPAHGLFLKKINYPEFAILN